MSNESQTLFFGLKTCHLLCSANGRFIDIQPPFWHNLVYNPTVKHQTNALIEMSRLSFVWSASLSGWKSDTGKQPKIPLELLTERLVDSGQ
jgi:hypothetical protein